MKFLKYTLLQIVHDFLVFHQGTGYVFEEVPDFWVVFEAVPILSEDEITSNVERLNAEVMEEDDSAASSRKEEKKISGFMFRF